MTEDKAGDLTKRRRIWMTPYREVMNTGEGEVFDDDIDPESDLGKKLVFKEGLRPMIYLVPVDADVVEFFKDSEAVNEALRRLMSEAQTGSVQ